jgi:cyclopropane-fatty-acyl-phospholipid synthase
MKTAIRLVERGLVPDRLVRHGIRRLLGERLREQRSAFQPDPAAALERWVACMRSGPVAAVPERANEQHYELPPRFFELVLGPHLKYSSALFEQPEDDPTGLERVGLGAAEEAMLALTCERAGLRVDVPQRVLELGCGWGSLTLWMAARYPRSSILAVSNSAPQREHVLARAAERGLDNVEVVTRDMNVFDTDRRFDRIVSVEMFEHMRNWERLLGRASRWLEPDGRLFLHVFAHRDYAYPFEVRGDSDWMSELFFTGGMMPSHGLLDHLDQPFEVEQRWAVSGQHYARTAEAWLANLDARRDEVLEVLRGTYGDQSGTWLRRWRVFFLSCAELFGYRGGDEWLVSHNRLRLRGGGA